MSDAVSLGKEDDHSREWRALERRQMAVELEMIDRDKKAHTGAGRFLERVEALGRPARKAADA